MSEQNNPLDPLAPKQEEKWETTPSLTSTRDNLAPDTKESTPVSMIDSLISSPTPEEPQKKEETIKEVQSMTDIIEILIKNEYDYVKIEPTPEKVPVSFVKWENVIKEIEIKFPVYNTIIHSVKTATGLDVSTLEKVQEWKWSYKFEQKNIEIISKIAPSSNGEKLWFKAKQVLVSETKEKKKIPLGQILWFLGGIAFVALVLWGAFITFVVLNAKTVDDVKFFYSLWISLNDINTFITKVVTIIFSTLLFLETILLSIWLFKFWLTKKELKRKKTLFWILSLFLLITTFSTGTAWMFIDKKIKSLPNWQEVAYGNVKILDNDKLVSGKFDTGGAIISDTTKIIWPVTIKYDLSLFAKREEQKWYTIKKYIWNFWDNQIVEELNPTIIKKFDKKWTYNVTLSVIEKDLTGKEIEKKVDDIKEISIINVVKVEQKKLPNGWIQASFDASSLKDLGKIEWYFEDNLNEPIGKWEKFIPGKIFFEETLVWMRIVKDGEKSDTFDKVFVIAGNEWSSISWEISAEQSLENELSYTFRVKNIKNDFQDGFVEEFKWIIGDKEYTRKWDPIKLEESSLIKHEFSGYGKQDVKVILKDAEWNQKELTLQVNITKILKLKNAITISNSSTNAPVENIRYDTKAHEYFISDLWSPTKLRLDAREVRADNFIYSLTDSAITWDLDGDDNKDTTGKIAEFEINTPGNYVVTVNYSFQHRKITDEVINIKEKIYIEAVKKEAILDLKIEKPSDYVPVIVRFDASRSEIKDDNIIKFIYDYGDGTPPEERDAINPGRQYLKPGDYTVKLKVVTEKGKEYSTSKKLILKSQPEIAEIGMSMKNAPVWQGIDFTSDGSSGQMISFFWNFGDGNTSTDPNPTHAYKTPGKYEVTLRVGYANNNFLEDKVEVTITE
jgi:PKD repeat protein